MCAQIAFGEQLLIGLNDDASRQPEISCERPRRRQRRPVPKLTALDRAAQLAFELEPHRHAARSVDTHQQVDGRTGPFHTYGLLLRIVPLD